MQRIVYSEISNSPRRSLWVCMGSYEEEAKTVQGEPLPTANGRIKKGPSIIMLEI